MNTRPLVIDEETKRKVKGLIATAKENPYDFHRLKRVCEGVEKAVGDHYRIQIPVGYEVAYSLEQLYIWKTKRTNANLVPLMLFLNMMGSCNVSRCN
jgi:hypothetical protein